MISDEIHQEIINIAYICYCFLNYLLIPNTQISAVEKLVKKLEGLKLPTLVLIKNLELKDPYRDDPEFVAGEFIESSDNYYNLKRLIPDPEYPSNAEAQELLKFKLGDDRLKGNFSDIPSDLNSDLPDSKIFNCSYTILWAVPPDINSMVNTLLGMINVGVGQDVVTEKYLDRMIVLPSGCLENKTEHELGFNFQVQEVFYAKLNSN